MRIYINFMTGKIAQLGSRIKISSKPETLKTLLFKYGRVIVEMDKIENDYTRSCKYGDLLIVEPGSPKVTKAKRYVVGINDKLIYCSAMQQKRRKDKLIILGIGEISISDIVIWCNAKKRISTRNI